MNLDQMTSLLGYKDTNELILKYVLPILGLSIGTFLIFLLFFPSFPAYFAYIILGLGIGFLFIYPIALFEKKKISIDENLHLFITYAGTISTMKIGRGLLFKRIAQKKVFGEISNIAQKIHYLARSWNLGFARTCRKIGTLIPSQILADFFDRFAVVMDFGQDLEVFLVDEQDSIMEDYATEYKKSLENIKMIQDVFISISVSIAFMLAMALMMPLIMGTPMDLIIQFAVLGILAVDGLIYLLIKAFIPSDRIPHSLDIKNEGMLKIQKTFYIILPISVALSITLLILDKLPFLVNIALGCTPLAYVGYLANQEEKNIKRRDQIFPTFIRTLGSAVEVRSGAVVSSLYSLQVHDFSLLNPMVINVYRRLKLGSEKIQTWLYFAGETGSHLIYHFIRIFTESVYLGGNAEKIGEIVSKNFITLMSLRKRRMQLAQGLKGAFYGSLVGLSSAVYVSAEITNTLATLFNQPIDGENSINALVGSITPQIATVDLGKISIYIGIMILIHSFVSAILMKAIDGGFKYGCLIDFILMLWLGAIISIIMPSLAGNLIPSMGSMTGPQI